MYVHCRLLCIYLEYCVLLDQNYINVRECRRGQSKFVNPEKQCKTTTQCVGYHYRKTNTNNVNKTRDLLQTTGGKDERTSLSCGNSNGPHNTNLRKQRHIIGQHKN